MEVSSALCFAWAGYLVHRDVLPPVHNIVARNEHCVQRTLPARTVFFVYIIIRWTQGGGVCKACFSPSLCVFHPICLLLGGPPKGARAHNLLMKFYSLGNSKMEITSQRLLDQSQTGVYRGKMPHSPPFWAF